MTEKDLPDFPERTHDMPGAAYFDILAQRALERHRTRQHRRYLGAAFFVLILAGAGLMRLYHTSSHRDKVMTHEALQTPDSEGQEFRLIANDHRPVPDSPSEKTIREQLHLNPSAPQYDTIITEDDVLEFLIDENYIDA